MISIIIPVFRVEPYIEKCIKSILEQNNAEFEAIVINDNTDDLSMNICRSLVCDDKRFRIIDLHNNVGVGVARNVGLEHAKGDFIYFLDPDDYLCSGILHNISFYSQNGADVIRSDCILLRDDMQIGMWQFGEKADDFEKINMYSCYFYARQFLERYAIRFPSLRMAQDQVFLLDAMTYSPKCIDINIPSFYYCRYAKRYNRFRYTTSFARDHLKAEQEMLDIIIERDAYSFTNAVCRSIEKLVMQADRFIPFMDIAELIDYHYELCKLRNKVIYIEEKLHESVGAGDYLKELGKKIVDKRENLVF